MFNSGLSYAFAVGFFFSLAPLIMKQVQIGALMMAFFIAVGSLLAMVFIPFTNFWSAPSTGDLALATVAGIANGIGLIAFYMIVWGSNSGQWEFSKIAPIGLVLAPAGFAIGGRLFYGEPITAAKVVGLVFAGLAIFFLNR